MLKNISTTSSTSRIAQRKPGIPLNIFIAHASARRKLPKGYKYLKDELGAMIFNGQSVVGDGTTEKITAMLTGLKRTTHCPFVIAFFIC